MFDSHNFMSITIPKGHTGVSDFPKVTVVSVSSAGARNQVSWFLVQCSVHSIAATFPIDSCQILLRSQEQDRWFERSIILLFIWQSLGVRQVLCPSMEVRKAWHWDNLFLLQVQSALLSSSPCATWQKTSYRRQSHQRSFAWQNKMKRK